MKKLSKLVKATVQGKFFCSNPIREADFEQTGCGETLQSAAPSPDVAKAEEWLRGQKEQRCDVIVAELDRRAAEIARLTTMIRSATICVLRLSREDRKRVWPCPFCGDAKVDLGFRSGLHWALCRGCGTEFAGAPSVEGAKAEQAIGWWNWRHGEPGVPDAVAVDCAIRCLASVTGMLAPKVSGSRGKPVKFPAVEAVLAACSVALGELRGVYAGPFGRRRFRVPLGPRRPDRVTGGQRVS